MFRISGLLLRAEQAGSPNDKNPRHTSRSSALTRNGVVGDMSAALPMPLNEMTQLTKVDLVIDIPVEDGRNEDVDVLFGRLDTAPSLHRLRLDISEPMEEVHPTPRNLEPIFQVQPRCKTSLILKSILIPP